VTRSPPWCRLVDAGHRRAIEVDIGRLDVDDPRLEQRLAWRHRDLLVDEMRHTSLARAGQQCLAERLQRLGLFSLERAERHRAGTGLARRHQDFGSPDGKSKEAHAGPLEKDAPLQIAQRFGVQGFSVQRFGVQRFGVHAFLPFDRFGIDLEGE
jgi:hypothetical protein